MALGEAGAKVFAPRPSADFARNPFGREHFLFSPVGFKENLSLLFSVFPGYLSEWRNPSLFIGS